MTRINCGIKPENLIDQHLTAELFEIVRVPTLAKRILLRGPIHHIPAKFVLGAGHVRFFYNKLSYINNRYLRLKAEFESRFDKQYGGTYDSECLIDNPLLPLYNDYIPADSDRDLLINRISERIIGMSGAPRYCGVKLTTQQALDLLNR